MLTDGIKYVLAAFLALSLLSCDPHKKDDPQEKEAVISIGGVGVEGICEDALFCGRTTVTVQSNMPWTATPDCDWLLVEPSCGEAGEFYEVDVRFKYRNFASGSRDGRIVISAGDKTVSIAVRQEGFSPVEHGFDNPETVTDGHPLLLATGSEFTKMRNLACSDPLIRVIHEYLMRYADKALELAPQEYSVDGTRLLNVSIEACKRLFYLSYAYRMCGDRRYAERAGTEILSLAAFQDWHPSHFLDDAEIMLGVSIAYDWCYPALTQEVRAAAEGALLEKGLNPYFSDWTGATNNWNQVCNAAALFAAYAIADKAPDIVTRVEERTVDMVPEAMRNYAPDGTYVEGPGYWNYGTSYNVLLLDAFQRRYGDTRGLLEAYPEFLKTSDYIDAAMTPSFRVFTYADQAFPAQVSIVPFYMYDLKDDPTCLFSVSRLLRRSILNTEHCRHERVLPAAVVFAARGGELRVSEPASRSFIGDGVTAMASFRGSWTDEGASYMAIKLGRPSSSHGHMDVGTFCFESGGVQWATDLGGENYSALEKAGVDLWGTAQNSERWTVLRCALRGHNCLAFDAFDQKVDRFGIFTAKDPVGQSVSSDLSALYEGQVESVTRTVSLRGGKDGVVHDVIKVGGTARRLRWNMCTEAVRIEFHENGATLHSADGQTLEMRVSGAEGAVMKTWDAKPSRKVESANSQIFVGFELELAAGKTYDITVELKPTE